VFRASHALRNKSRVIGALALASAIVLLSFGTAQAQTATTTTLTSSPNPSVAGQPVTVTAAISGSGGTPSGTVTFFADGNSIGTGTLGSSGQATVTIATLAVGSHTITTTYQGDSNFNGSNGGPLTQTVNKNDTTTLVLSSINPSEFGQSVTFTAAISPVTGTGGASTERHSELLRRRHCDRHRYAWQQRPSHPHHLDARGGQPHHHHDLCRRH